MENKKENIKKKAWFTENVKQPSKAGMMCTMDGDAFFSFTKNAWIDSSASCHITNNNTSLFGNININIMIQGSSGIMPATKKASYMSTSNNSIGQSRFTLYGP